MSQPSVVPHFHPKPQEDTNPHVLSQFQIQEERDSSHGRKVLHGLVGPHFMPICVTPAVRQKGSSDSFRIDWLVKSFVKRDLV